MINNPPPKKTWNQGRDSIPVNKASQPSPGSQPTSQEASQEARKPARKPGSQLSPASQPASKNNYLFLFNHPGGLYYFVYYFFTFPGAKHLFSFIIHTGFINHRGAKITLNFTFFHQNNYLFFINSRGFINRPGRWTFQKTSILCILYIMIL